MKYTTPQTTEDLELLFEFVSPIELRKRISHIFFSYLANTPPEVLPNDFPQLAEDISFLLDFLEKAETNSVNCQP